jgi:lactate dehydrogenase-like 2-hydroxyacid dehydrogenase
VQALGTGVTPLLQCQKLKTDDSIVLTNMRSASSVLLAEFCVFGLLFFYKQFSVFQQRFLDQNPISERLVLSVENLNVLVLGVGSIGQEIAKKFKYGFGMNISGVERDATKIANSKDLLDEVLSLEDVAAHVHKYDVIVNALPSIPGGPLFTEEMISKMKKGSVFINVGRGNIIDEKALIKYLLNDHLMGAALDVICDEPITPDSHFYDERLKNKLIYSFHKMHRSVDYERKLEELLEENVINYLSDKPLLRIVDKKLGY